MRWPGAAAGCRRRSSPETPGRVPAPIIYIETFATAPEDQESVALAAGDLVRAGEDALDASGEVLRSMDGLRVLIVWRWSGAAPSLLLREGGLLRQALAEHEPLLRADAKEAHVFTSL